VYRRQRKLQDITLHLKATVCEQFASTIFADLLHRIDRLQSGAHLVIWSALNMTGAQVIVLNYCDSSSDTNILINNHAT